MATAAGSGNGRWAVVTRDVAARALVRGTPAVIVGWVGRGGRALDEVDEVLIDVDTGERFERTEEGLEASQ